VRDSFARDYNVSRETLSRLDIYVALLEKWTARINLVSKASLANVWDRHIADSAQVWALKPDVPRIWTDLGSGGGLPGLVIAILAAEDASEMTVHLVESDTRKSAFLSTVVRECGLSARVHAERIEQVALPSADVVSARALAPLPELLALAENLRRPEGIFLFPKGETVHKEITDASRSWRFDYRVHPSRTDKRAAIVEIGTFARV
jgi:16S rRNA (guanine527-N7)-methyltransferase